METKSNAAARKNPAKPANQSHARRANRCFYRNCELCLSVCLTSFEETAEFAVGGVFLVQKRKIPLVNVSNHSSQDTRSILPSPFCL
jgi:hypothetical protein